MRERLAPEQVPAAPGAGQTERRSGPSRGGLLQMQAAAGNRAVCQLLHAGTGQQVRQRQTATTTAAMSRTDFAAALKRRFGIGEIRAGTFDEQATAVNSRPGIQPSGRLTQQAWTAWDPGDTSPIYQSIVSAFDDFETRLGGVPPTMSIVFFATAYDVNNGQVVADPNTGADFGAGQMRVYQAGVQSSLGGRKALPIGRSNTSNTYPPVGIGVTGTGSTPGAPMPLLTADQSIRRTISHELGHGLAEQAMAANPGMFTEYHQAVGWVAGHLFDIGVPAVRAAIAAGTPPPATAEITGDNWNNPRWIEQPVSNYMVAGGPGEDFAEAVMTYVENAALLRDRSPARNAFLEAHREPWLPYLVKEPPVGDFPESSGDTRLA